MKRLLKMVKISVAILVSLIVLLFVASQVMQEKVAGIIISSLNRNISTKLEAGSYRLSFLRRFPRASLELRNVLVHSSPKFARTEFGSDDTDTLLWAPAVSVEFSIIKAAAGNYAIERIGARDGLVRILTDKSGKVNYEIAEKSAGGQAADFSLELEKIYLTRMTAEYNNLSAGLFMQGLIDDGRLRLAINGDDLDLTATGKVMMEQFSISGVRLPRPLATSVDLSLLDNEKGISFRKAVLKIENYDLSLTGTISKDDVYDLTIKGNNLDISKIRSYLPEKYYNYFASYDPEGILVLNSTIRGQFTRDRNPHVEIDCQLRKGKVEYGKSRLSLNSLSFSAFFTNGSLNSRKSSSVTVKDFRASLGSAQYAGSFTLTDLVKPKADLELRGKVIPAELRDFFGIGFISSAGGSADIDLRLRKTELQGDSLSVYSFLSMNPSAEIKFNSLTLGMNSDSLFLGNITGDLSFGQRSSTAGLDFVYNGQHIRLSGEFSNLPGWIAGDGSMLNADATVWFSRFIPEVFLAWGDKSTNDSGVDLPDDISAKVNFTADTLEYGRINAGNIKGALTYKPKVLTFNSMYFSALDGSFSGTGFLSENPGGSFLSKGNYNLKDVDINGAFRAFNNFGQDFIRAQNLSGRISGSIALLLPMDPLLKADTKAISAEGRYVISDGALIDFEPIKQLSDFIELSELQNIRFEELENDFFIRNNQFFVPQMDVRSSAADLSINGTHSFSNIYEYHVKIRLSELLSGKRKRDAARVSEFGVVEDDGLGRTSILLRIEGNDEDVKVGYDFKAASAGVKNSMKKEKENLKSILNQEYGWFGSDSAARTRPAEKKQRFKITWDEGAVNKEKESPPETGKKEGGIKSIFKKKNN